MSHYYSFDKFTLDNFSSLFLTNKGNTIPKNDIPAMFNERVLYLYEYLNGLKCQSMLIEKKYIDKDYLIDNQEFYIRCFSNYDKYCKRIHFFSDEILNIEQILKSAKEFRQDSTKVYYDNLQKSYLGFIVIKPLNQKYVGKTCLKNYGIEGGIRNFLAVRDYTVNLFGIDFIVNSLAFQEQDTTVSSCATISLWSAFQKTSKMFGHFLPSPSEITKIATKNYLSFDRIFPTYGLTLEQILDAIRQIGLTYEILNLNQNINYKEYIGTIYAYLKMKLPIILATNIDNTNYHHTLTITGYRLNDSPKFDFKIDNDITLVPEIITKLYVHDDQVGPFCRADIMTDKDKNYPLSIDIPKRNPRYYIPLYLIYHYILKYEIILKQY